jgi:hypothetical protein
MDLGTNPPSQAIMDQPLSLAIETTGQLPCGLEASTSQSFTYRKQQYTHSEWQSKKTLIEELYINSGVYQNRRSRI